MKRLQAHPRRAFTLVEILIVILIIGFLVALLLPAIRSAIGKTNNAAVTLEINNMANVLESNKETWGGYPPCMGDNAPVVADAVLIRQNRFMSTVRKLWPRYQAQTAFGTSTSTGVRGVIYSIYHPSSNPFPAAIANQMTTWGDINNLDQAEALVFWLGGLRGIPGVHTTKLVGFGAGAATPFAALTDNSSPPPVAIGARTPKLFEFDETRLLDADNDGWLEYYPNLDVDASEKSPYVYYDGPTISRTVASGAPYRQYPAPANGALPQLGPGAAGSNIWGVAVPYGEVTNSVVSVINPKKFQIICAGQDGLYGEEGTPGLRAPIPSTGAELLPGDNDNLTNIFGGKIEDERE